MDLTARQKTLVRVLLFVAQILNEDHKIAEELRQLAIHIRVNCCD